MKHVSVSSFLQASEIRPSTLMADFKRLSIEDSRTFFLNTAKIVEVPCPACGKDDCDVYFVKYDFKYNICHNCHSVYVSPRPTDESLAEYYRYSRASRFRYENLGKNTAYARGNHVLRTYVNWIGRIVNEIQSAKLKASYTDIGTGLSQIFEELDSVQIFETLQAFEPMISMKELSMDVQILNTPPRDQLAVSSFEKLEHQFSPHDYLNRASQMLSPDGVLFVTTRTISGFDLQILGGNAPYIFVPEHLNLLSIEGIDHLIQKIGLTIVEMSTPGQLDLQFVQHALEENSDIEIPHFLQYLLDHRDEEAHADFQSFLQKHRLSSHLRIAVSRKKRNV